MKCSRCQQENPTSQEFCGRCGGPLSLAGGAPNPDLQTEIERLRRLLTEAAEQQAATAEILRVISHSPTQLKPVLDAIATNAARVCGANDATVLLREGGVMRRVAHDGPIDSAVLEVRTIDRDSVGGRAVLDREPVHVHDILAMAPTDLSWSFKSAQRAGFRTILAVPLLREGNAIGCVTIRRREVRPFSDKQVALLQTFADQAVIAIENVRLFNETKEALGRQTATAEILRVIASSPTELQPALDSIATHAALVCDAYDAVVLLREGDRVRYAAHYGPITITLPRTTLSRDSVSEAAILDRQPVHVHDLLATEPPVFPLTAKAAREGGFRTALSVPLLRENEAIGALAIRRREVQPFTTQQIDLLKTFADQAVIAIENVRLFTEIQEKNRALTQAHGQVTEALERQTATSEILGAISSSPTDVQPVFDSLIASAARLGKANDVILLIREGDVLRPVAGVGAFWESLAVDFRVPLVRGSVAARSVIDGTTLHVPDLAVASEADFTLGRDLQRRFGHRTVLAVPLVREGISLGTIFAMRFEIRPFEDQQIALLKTFADQAVIAIENVRLFTELQASNRELRTALDTQTATSDVLRVISRSPADVQPVFDAIVESAVRLLRGFVAAISRLAGDQLELAAFTSMDPAGDAAVRSAFPQALASDWPHARVVRERALLNVTDARSDPQLPEAIRNVAVVRGYQSLLVLPMLRHDEAIGAISVTRREPGGFADDEVSLLQTFADQAVIAIENARLLTELQARTKELSRSVGQLTALGEVGRAVSSTLDLETVLTTIVSRAVGLSGLDGGVVFEYDEGPEEFVHRAATEAGGALAEARRATRVRKGEGVVGQTAITLEPALVPDIAVPGAYESRLRENLLASGIRAVLAVPMVFENRLIGCLVVSRNRPGEFPADTIELLRTFAVQSALAIQNARLFQELATKGRELEAASRHKSEFLANMSHELRTPLNAVIGFSEVLSERMFGELNEKQDEYLKDIHASGQHLLSLINDILDLSKIEAGRMELELSEFNLPATLDNALTLVRERAGRRSIALNLSVDQRLEQIQADERKVRQVVLNLLSNAIKFTPEGGRIDVRAVPVDGNVEVSLTDTGVGIAPEDQDAIFEEFKQVGTAAKKVEGTGLGLALSRKFIELHGGKIWVQSQIGQGSTFTFTIPVRRGE